MRCRALVMKNLQADCFGGTTFHADNDITARIKTGDILIHNKFVVQQSNQVSQLPIFPPPSQQSVQSSACLTTSNPVSSEPFNSPAKDLLPPPSTPPHELKFNAISMPSSSVTLSGEFLSIPLPSSLTHLHHIGIIPNFPSIPDKVTDSLHWLPQVCEVYHGQALYPNASRDAILAPKYAHFKPQLVNEFELADLAIPINISDRFKPTVQMTKLNAGKLHHSLVPARTLELISQIKINKTPLSEDQESRLQMIHKVNHRVFDNDLTEGYNHHAGEFYARFTFTTKPPPTRVFVPQYNKRCSSIQQAKCDELEAQGVLVDPKTHGIPVLHVSPSWIQQKGRAKHKDLQDCALDELRFITAFNSLNDTIRPQPSRSCSSSAIFTFLSKWRFHIYGDLNNSYFQLPVQKSLWCYLGIMTPHKGIRVMTRTGQGLLGSDVELEELMCRILGEDINSGYCIAIRDDIIIGGDTIDEALTNYETILVKLNLNNLKLSPNKVRIFPADTEIYGYRIKDGCVEPSPHIIKTLGQSKMESLTTVKQVNSWKGLYKTLIGHLPALATVMSPFDSATGGKNSRETFVWTPELSVAFNVAMSHLQKINKTYLPAPNEQLLLLPDTMSVSPCTGWVLYTRRDGKLLPVTFCSAKLKDYMVKWFPCEKEGVGTVLAIEHCAHWISESELTTLVGPDSSAVVQAADLIRKGKHSSNPRLQSLLASVNRRNVKFFHNSAKSGKHVVPDSLSRLKDTTCKSKDCAVERFLEDIPVKLESMSITLLSVSLEQALPPVIIAATSAELSELLTTRSGPIPLGSRQTWIDIQKSDADCNAVFKQKTSGDAPRKKSTNSNINKIFKESIVHQGLLVVRVFDDKRMKEVDKVVVPPTYLDSILTVVHIRLNHPTQYQLRQVFERHFFSPKLELALDLLYQSCFLCLSFKKFPKELDMFAPALFPDHPGTHMNVDIIKRSGQLILVNIDLFSGFVTCCFATSETANDLCKAIIDVITPIRHADIVQVRVDKAPGLASLARNETSDLTKLGIKLELPLDDNKNSNCCVDKAINDLEVELKKLSPSGQKISSLELAQATTCLNNKIRNRGYTAAEIHFSRDSNDHMNLNLDDSKLQSDQISKRFNNHGPSSASKTPSGKPQNPPDLSQGDLVYIKSHGSKHQVRDPHIVVKNSGQSAVLRKTLHSSPQDGRPISIASQDRVVATKFIFRPKCRPPNSIFAPYPTEHEDTRHTPTHPAPLLWDPIDREGILLPQLCDIDYAMEAIDTIDPDASLGSQYDEVLANDVASEEPVDSSDESLSNVDTSSGPEVVIFDAEDGLFEDEKLNQTRLPVKNDRVAYFDTNLGGWKKVILTSNVLKRWKHYYNCIDEMGATGGVYLIPDQRWTLIGDSSDTDSSTESAAPALGVIHQVDGIAMPDSATPDTTPEKEAEPMSTNDPQAPSDITTSAGTCPGARPKSKVRLVPGEYLLDTSDSDSEIPQHDAAFTAAPDWDNLGTDLECCDMQEDQLTYRSIPLDRAVNLDEVLPLTSTPYQSPSNENDRRRRISALRRPLPAERDQSESRFISKLNPFRKRN